MFVKGTMSRSSRTLYVGNLPGDTREREVEDLFYKYGPIAHIDLKIPPRPPGYAFVEVSFSCFDCSFIGNFMCNIICNIFFSQFEESRDAEDAIRGRDGYDFDGNRLRVELAHGGRGHSSSIDRYSSHSSGRGSRGGGVSRRSEYRVLVTGLPSSASWQDLKDHMRRAGDVCFSQVFRDGRGTTGIVDYTNYDDMKYAIRKLDDSEFRNAFSKGFVRVREYKSSRSRSPSNSRSPSRSGSYSRGRSYSRSRSRSRRLDSSFRRPNLPGGHLLDLLQDPLLLGLDQSRVHCRDMDYAAIWGLHIRIFVGYGSNPNATILVVEISIKIKISRAVFNVTKLDLLYLSTNKYLKERFPVEHLLVFHWKIDYMYARNLPVKVRQSTVLAGAGAGVRVYPGPILLHIGVVGLQLNLFTPNAVNEGMVLYPIICVGTQYLPNLPLVLLVSFELCHILQKPLGLWLNGAAFPKTSEVLDIDFWVISMADSQWREEDEVRLTGIALNVVTCFPVLIGKHYVWAQPNKVGFEA
ncbi:hypothetical protein RHGRI_003055 [Rhododendron griersonianum]|uniref:RRM domain-containing protein n=1 Tax=Rhododendron griersonianum TaxID=479676 RepID=A0AAV6LTX6_9ERIC|nr:hypothetical protein RHGRI_003055 [Rhododendron griersonianum]